MGRLRVGIDVSPLALTRAGTSRYLRSLLAELEGRPDEIELERYALTGEGRATKIARDAGWYPAVLPRLAARDRVDILHCPGPRAPLVSPVPLVVTIHDLAVLRHPRAFNAWTRRYSASTLPRIARAARLVLTVSEFSRREAIELLDLAPERVRAIPNGVGAPFGVDGPRVEGRYVLVVGTLEPRKNLARTIEGFLRADLDGHELRVVGASGWGDVRLAARERIRWLGEVPDEELAALYRGAACVAYLSLYEGFGIPVLEALACGVPVVCPPGPPYDEFADGVAVHADPLDPAAIARGLEQAVARRAELAPLGPARAAAYDWARTAALTLAAYREAAA
ncbi:MAG: glycosyltransferase family 1 protein [Thermoleophilia bacterium]